MIVYTKVSSALVSFYYKHLASIKIRQEILSYAISLLTTGVIPYYFLIIIFKILFLSGNVINFPLKLKVNKT